MAFPDTELDITVEAYLGANPNDAPGTWPAATDLSSRLLDKPIQITRGRGSGQRTLSSGSATLWLDNGAIGDGVGANAAGVLTPLQAMSPYYGLWDVGVPVRISVNGVGASPPYRRFCGYVAAIEQLFIPGVGGNNLSVVKVTLGGLVRQLTQGSVEKSAMRRYYDQVTPAPTAYWPLEFGGRRAALTFPSPIAGVSPVAVEQSTLFGVTRPFSAAGGATPGPVGASSATDTSAGGRLVGRVPIVAGATHVRAEVSMLANGYDNTFPGLLYLYNPIPATSGFTRIGVVAQDLGSGWQLGVDWTGPSGSAASYASGVILLQDNAWHLVQLDIMSSGGGANTDFIVRVDGVQVHIGTATGLPWSPNNYVRTNTLAVDIDLTAHLVAWSGTTLPTATDSYAAFLGMPDEQAHDRLERICTAAGLPHSTTATDSLVVGTQPFGDDVAILRDLELADHGVLTELLSTWGFGYLSSSERSNLTPAMTVDLSTYETTEGTSSQVSQPVRNDARLRNEWTITNQTGGEETYVDAVSQAKHRRRDDSAVVNVPDDQLLNEAGWRTRVTTDDSPRHQTMPVDLGANATTLLPPWLELDLGARIDRTDHPTPEHPHEDDRVILEGYTETIRRKSWTVTLVVEPYAPWQVNVLAEDDPGDDDPYVGWLDYDSCELGVGVDDDDVLWSIACDPADSSDADDFPRRHYIGGELVTVTASTGGTTPTWTVTRFVNGVVKSHLAGAEIELADPIVLSL